MLFKNKGVQFILTKLQKRVEKKFGKKLSLELLHKIVDSQFKYVTDSMQELQPKIGLPKIGRFEFITSERNKAIIKTLQNRVTPAIDEGDNFKLVRELKPFISK